MSMETFSERTGAAKPVSLRQEEVPTVEMPVVEIAPDLHHTYGSRQERRLRPQTSGRNVLRVWWQKVSTFLLGHLV